MYVVSINISLILLPSEATTNLPTQAPTRRPGCGLGKQDIVFMLESSSSVGRYGFRRMLDFMKDFLYNYDVDAGQVRVGVVTYGTDVTIVFFLDTFTRRQILFEAIDNIPYTRGNTNTAGALQAMHLAMFNEPNGDRPEAENIAILITDSVSNVNYGRTQAEAEDARNAGITIYAIGVGLADTTEIKGISSKPSNRHIFLIQNFAELPDIQVELYEASCPGNVENASTARDLLVVLPKLIYVTQSQFPLVVLVSASIARRQFSLAQQKAYCFFNL
ncbi:matrilin-2-like [Mizuhopecten yessoensis]|uniref:matrilin-2-like n=1 Tax=Mizuhopecten yessoensis TaxID=6573 RepID=UPI000B45C239|nr:matrilin-2-like [Mizuhopecten yessoensis]